MYKCNDCGKVFEKPCSWDESRGEYFGFPAYETMYGCPYCKGDFDEYEEDTEE